MKQTKEKRLYESPTMQVIELKQQSQLLQASKPDYDSEPWSRELMDGLSSDGFLMEEQ